MDTQTWEADSSASFVGGALVLKGGIHAYGPVRVTNGVVRARIQGPGAQLRLGQHLMWFHHSDNRIGWFGLGRTSGQYKDISPAVRVRLSAENACEMALAVHGRSVRMYVNGRRVYEMDDDAGEGRAGASTNKNKDGVTFSNLEVFVLDGTDLTPADALKR
jgi:hypothetical protein